MIIIRVTCQKCNSTVEVLTGTDLLIFVLI